MHSSGSATSSCHRELRNATSLSAILAFPWAWHSEASWKMLSVRSQTARDRNALAMSGKPILRCPMPAYSHLHEKYQEGGEQQPQGRQVCGQKAVLHCCGRAVRADGITSFGNARGRHRYLLEACSKNKSVTLAGKSARPSPRQHWSPHNVRGTAGISPQTDGGDRGALIGSGRAPLT